jgi:hypothetical protein
MRSMSVGSMPIARAELPNGRTSHGSLSKAEPSKSLAPVASKLTSFSRPMGRRLAASGTARARLAPCARVVSYAEGDTTRHLSHQGATENFFAFSSLDGNSRRSLDHLYRPKNAVSPSDSGSHISLAVKA